MSAPVLVRLLSRVVARKTFASALSRHAEVFYGKGDGCYSIAELIGSLLVCLVCERLPEGVAQNDSCRFVHGDLLCWAILPEREQPRPEELLFYNSHYSHNSHVFRCESASLVLEAWSRP